MAISHKSSATLTLALNITAGSWLGFVVRDEMLAPFEWSSSPPPSPQMPLLFREELKSLLKKERGGEVSRQSKAYWHSPSFKMRVLCIFLSGNTGQVTGLTPQWVVSLATKLSLTARQLSSFIRSPHCLCRFNQPNFFPFLISTIF